MIPKEEVREYNAKMKAFLADIWNIVPKGQQKQFLKDPRKKALLDRYGIPYEV